MFAIVEVHKLLQMGERGEKNKYSAVYGSHLPLPLISISCRSTLQITRPLLAEERKSKRKAPEGKEYKAGPVLADLSYNLS